MMMKFVLSGYYGFDNAGDEALLSAICSTIKRIEPEADFTVFSGAPQKTTTLHGLRAVDRMNPFVVLRELWRADLLISGGGSLLQDVTGPRSLPYYISIVALALLLGKPVIFYAQGVGPINRPFSKFLMRLIANRVDLITLRDEDSRQLLQEMGVSRPPVKITADPVFTLEPSPGDYQAMEELLQAMGLWESRAIGVSVRKWEELEGYQVQLARVLDFLVEKGYRVLFLPMDYPADLKESQRVGTLMQQPYYLVDKHLNSAEHIALISRLDMMIGMRLHSLIFAASRGVPFAGISYDPKIDAFLKNFQLQPLSRDFDTMCTQIRELLENQNLKDQIKDQAREMRARARENARLTLDLVHSRRAGDKRER